MDWNDQKRLDKAAAAEQKRKDADAAAWQHQTPAGETEYVLELLDEDGVWMLRGDYDDRDDAINAMEHEAHVQLRPHRVVRRDVVATTDDPTS